MDIILEKSKFDIVILLKILIASRCEWRSDENRRVTDILVAEVRGLNPDFKSHEIEVSARGVIN